MAVTRPEITGRAIGDHRPLAITVKQASDLSGFGLTSIWAFLRDGRLQAVRVPGVRRTLVSYPSLTRLLGPPSASVPPPRKRGRPRQEAMHEAAP